MRSIKFLFVFLCFWAGVAEATLPAGQALEPYTGLVASRTTAPTTINTTNRQAMSRSPHYARTTICSAAIVIPNFMVQTASPFAEVGTGSAATVTASFEYPMGTMTQITFAGGNTSGSVPDVSYLVSDSVAIPGCIPRGALFAVRIYWTSTTGILSVGQSLNTVGSTGFEQGVSGITDKTMSGSVTGSSTNFPPIAIIGTTDQPSFAVLGDSIGYGQGDAQDVGGDYGFIMKSLGPFYAYMNLTRSGDQADKFVASSTNRAALLQYASHVVCEYGNNDIYTLGATGAAALTDLQAIWSAAHSAGAKVYQTTITARATSTDGWTTVNNQTVTNGNANRITLNSSIRSSTDHDGYLEVADVYETARDAGTWKPGQTANYFTADGTHPTAKGYALVVESGAINPFREGGHGVLMPAAGPLGTRSYSNGGIKGVLTGAAR